MQINISIMPKQAILDPQGKAIQQALHGLGFSTVTDARAGRVITIDYAGTNLTQARVDTERMLRESTFFNPIMESFEIKIKADVAIVRASYKKNSSSKTGIYVKEKLVISGKLRNNYLQKVELLLEALNISVDFYAAPQLRRGDNFPFDLSNLELKNRDETS